MEAPLLIAIASATLAIASMLNARRTDRQRIQRRLEAFAAPR